MLDRSWASKKPPPTKRQLALIIKALLDLVPNGTYQCRHALMDRSEMAVEKVLGKK